MIARRVLISGRVQGVNFRWATVREATGLDVHGWVRNLPDGRVEALVEGEEEAVDRLLGWLRRGPPTAGVDDLVVEPRPATGARGFHVTG